MNLSEQGLYGKAKAIWYGEDFGDGLNTVDTLEDMTGTYSFLNESDWTYNPSWSRVTDEDAETYRFSCTDCWRSCSSSPRACRW